MTKFLNGRNGGCKLDTHSFELVPQTTQLSTEEFYKKDEKRIKEVYYKEMEDLIRKHTGAEKVVVIHHQVRNGKRAGKTLKDKVQNYAPAVHTDSSCRSAEETFGQVVSGLDDKFKKGRFLYLNAWRNIDDSSPILNNTLAVCDERSLVKPDDYLYRDFYATEDTKVTQFGLASRNAAQHKWYTYPLMTKNEVLLFKQFDSDIKREARHCFHSSVFDPNSPSEPVR